MTNSPRSPRIGFNFGTVLSLVLATTLGCAAGATSDDAGGSGSGGSASGSGGSSSSGNGGSPAQGGNSGSGTGGSIATGSGGSSAKGGNSGNGGATGTGGVNGSGGANGSGGTTGSGGASATGGTTGKGGSTGAGGTTGSGGASATGGTTGKGGSTGAGGTSSTGGTTGTGGTSATGGTTGNNNPSGYPPAPGSGNVPQPSGTPGGLTVLNWAGFKAAVSYNFDDDNDSVISNYSTLEGLGVPFTFYLWTNRTEAMNAVWPMAVKNGHEMGNHTASHQSTPPGGVADINAATTFIQQNLKVTPYTMAAPNGASVYTGLAPTAMMMTNRGVSDALVMPNDNTDRYTLPCYIPPTGASASANFNPEVMGAQTGGGWRIILVHGFQENPQTDGAYQPVPLSEYVSGVNYTKSLGNIWIGRMVDVASYWLGQKAISSATKTTSGTSTTWTWTLPSNFAPGKYVRATVTGGTVTQKGTTVPWNPNGYYEISLDAGSVTVGP